jgi:hypothetical protein
MRRRIHAYEEEDTCIWGGGYMHMRRRIHAYEEENTCIWGGGYVSDAPAAHRAGLSAKDHLPQKKKIASEKKNLVVG